MRNCGCVDRLDEAEAAAPVGAPVMPNSVNRAELAVDHACGFECRQSGRRHAGGNLCHRLHRCVPSNSPPGR